jgi:two-component system, NtrC family, sensor kinase
MSSVSPSSRPPSSTAATSTALRSRLRLSYLAGAELVAIGWESVSGLLFATAVSPAVVARPWPVLIFVLSLVASALVSPWTARVDKPLFQTLYAARAIAWALALLPVVELTGSRAMLGAGAFGVMASGVRRALYRYARDLENGGIRARELVRTLNGRLAESTFVVGVVAGHILMLFLVAFLRTTNDQIRNAWWQVLPWLTLGGTLMFTLAVPRVTSLVTAALASGPSGPKQLLADGATRATRLPGQLALVNFGLWLACTTFGAFGFRGLFGWSAADATIVVAIGLLFAWGISFYQRAWHLGILAPAVDELRSWGAASTAELHGGSLRRRMLVDFGLPLVFSCTLSLVSSLGLYRALVGPLGSSAKEVLAVVGSFIVLVMTSGGVIVRAARELSRPMSTLAEAADRVGGGGLDVAVPHVIGPDEITRLGTSIERMRRTLATTIAELEAERAGLEEKVDARTAALSRALLELKETQSALLHGEKMASLGQLVAGIAHEINNPLSAIAGSIESLALRAAEARRVLERYRDLERELPAASQQEVGRLRREIDLDATLDDLDGIARVIRRSTDRAVRIVGDLLHFSRASSDRVPTDLHAGLDEALSLLGSHLRHEGVVVEKDYAPLPELLVRAGEVNQIFLNLLTNAWQAVSGRSPAEIRVTTRLLPTAVEVAVEDNGPGVPVELRTRIFDPFFTTKAAGQGTGLGLSISAQIAARHGGALSVEQAPRGGARFVLRLPLALAPSASAKAAPSVG